MNPTESRLEQQRYKALELTAMLLKWLHKEHNIQYKDMVLGGGVAVLLNNCRDNQTIGDVNLWITGTAFAKLAEDLKAIIHPLRDEVLTFPGSFLFIRKFNPYFKTEPATELRELVMSDAVRVFTAESLLVFKRGGFAEAARPQYKRDKDIQDIRNLTEVVRQRNLVRA